MHRTPPKCARRRKTAAAYHLRRHPGRDAPPRMSTQAAAAASEPSGEALAFDGRLFVYREKPRYVGFMGGAVDSPTCLVTIGGLGDGLGSVDYFNRATVALGSSGVCTVQFLMPSSFGGYGTSSLDADAINLGLLLECLRTKHQKTKFFLLGHSTGCQDIVHYFRCLASNPGGGHFSSFRGCDVHGVVLQAPSSDRFYKQAQNAPLLDQMLRHARDLVASKQAAALFMPRAAEGENVAITAERFLSLYGVGGDDDLFSHDLPDTSFASSLDGFPVNCRLMVVFCGADETVPVGVDSAILMEKFQCISATRCKSCEILVLQNADHAISQLSCQNSMILALNRFIFGH